MRVVQINMVHFGSTGKIMFQIAKTATKKGVDMRTFSTYLVSKRIIKLPKASDGHAYYGSPLGNLMHWLLARMTGKACFYSRFSTARLIHRIKKFDPHVIHLHNLHTGYLNLPMLFRYAKKADVHVIWTLHDCWAFTGKCPHFTMVGCDKWKNGCHNCPQWKPYTIGPDISAALWSRKKETFTSLQKLTLVTPSQWLADLTRQSFLKNYPVHVINNGIDLSVFMPTPSNLRLEWKCEDKFVLLGVSFGWGKRKGLDVFLELAKQLDDGYRIVLVGTDEMIEKQLPTNIIAVRRTANQMELAQIYTAADLFVNPTREENYPTVNMESLACGTPVITFQTGGSPEIIDDTCGCAVGCDDLPELKAQIERIRRERPYTRKACLKRAASFNMHHRFEEYVRLYHACAMDENASLSEKKERKVEDINV